MVDPVSTGLSSWGPGVALQDFPGSRPSIHGYMSHEKNPAILSIESWLFNRDPYNGLL